MSVSPLQTIREIAASLGRKTSPCEHFDSNVCVTDSPPDKPWVTIPIEGGPFTEHIQFRRERLNIELLANEDYLALQVKAELPFQNFSINQGDRRFGRFDFATEIKVGERRYPVFTRTGDLTAQQNQLLHSTDFSNFVAELELTDGESFHVTRGGLDIYVKDRSFDDAERILRGVVSLVAKLEVPAPILNFEKLPTIFHTLIPLLKIWAVSDDQQRANLIEKAESIELQEFIKEVAPFYGAINSYLDSFGEKELDESAIALGRLAEAATEAKLRLAKARRA